MIDGVDQLWGILQLSDSAFPTGSFAYSWGMETLVQEEVIRNSDQARKWLTHTLEFSWGPGDGRVTAMVWGAAQECAMKRVAEIDAWLTASRSSDELRRGALQTGRRLLTEASRLVNDPKVSDYRDTCMQESEILGNPAVVMGLLGSTLKWSVTNTVLAAGFQAANALVLALVKLVPLGQGEGQSLLRDAGIVVERLVQEVCDESSSEDMAQIAQVVPWLDIAGMRHEKLYTRLFRS